MLFAVSDTIVASFYTNMYAITAVFFIVTLSLFIVSFTFIAQKFINNKCI